MENIHGKTALITGAATGIGRATALAFARYGARVIVADIDDSQGSQTVDQIRRNGGDALFIHTDVTDGKAVRMLIEKALSTWGRLDFAHNNAGLATDRLTNTADFPEEEWHRSLAVNLTGVWHCMRHEIEVMLDRKEGAIVNTSSLAGLNAMPGASAYSAAKFGVIGITQAAALEYADVGIRINAVCPGYVLTPMVEKVFERNRGKRSKSAIEERIPLRRMGRPEDVASAVLWLCSSHASFVTGHSLPVDGGMNTNWAGA